MYVYYVSGIPFDNELYHHGIKGQKWGVRRYVNSDGTLTLEGKQRYGSIENFYASRQGQKLAKQNAGNQDQSASRSSRVKRGVKIGAAIVGAGLLAYGAYKAHSVFSDAYRSNITNIGKRAIETLEGQRKNALSQGRRRDRKKINLDYDRRREAILNVVADNKSTKAMYRNLGNGVKDIIKSRLRR